MAKKPFNSIFLYTEFNMHNSIGFASKVECQCAKKVIYKLDLKPK